MRLIQGNWLKAHQNRSGNDGDFGDVIRFFLWERFFLFSIVFSL